MSTLVYSRIGCAGWSLPRENRSAFSEQGSHLQRYAERFNAVEINSSFYRPHRPQTWQRWAQSVPADFRFSVKMPKAITHECRLKDAEGLLEQFLFQCGHLEEKLGCLLVQLPPSLAYEWNPADDFFAGLRQRYQGLLVLEPRHSSWGEAQAQGMLNDLHIAQVAADPSPISGGDQPAGWPGAQYWRLHGSPRIYHSAYEPAALQLLATKLQAASQSGIETWCIFDNTASGHAVSDALLLDAALGEIRLQR